jgi:hypothetical protein
METIMMNRIRILTIVAIVLTVAIGDVQSHTIGSELWVGPSATVYLFFGRTLPNDDWHRERESEIEHYIGYTTLDHEPSSA